LVEQHEFVRVRIEVDLIPQVADLELSHVVAEQDHRIDLDPVDGVPDTL
jgi:hypothetical protein